MLRHSCAHVLAQAVQELYPQTRLGIGPPIKDGFYYDFDPPEPFTPDDLAELEKRMQRDHQGRAAVPPSRRHRRRRAGRARRRAVQARADRPEGRRRRTTSRRSARSARELDDLRQPRREERRGLLERPVPRPAPADDPADPGVQADAHGRRVLAGEREEPAAAARSTARPGSPGRAQGAPAPMLEEAEKRDHRELGVELDLFSFPDELGSGPGGVPPQGRHRAARDGGLLAAAAHRGRGYEFVVHARTSPSQRCSRPPATSSGTPTACSRRCSSTRRSTPTATCGVRGRTTTSSR